MNGKQINVTSEAYRRSDPTVKQLILKLDQDDHTILMEDLDDQRLLVSANKLDYIRTELEKLLEENTYTSAIDLGKQ